MIRIPQVFAKGLRGRNVVLSASIAAGFGFTLFGYDQGVMSNVITNNDFLNLFPQMNNSSVSGIVVAIYEIGCLMGALTQIWLGDKLGRKNAMMLGMIIMTIGTVIMTSSYNLGQFIVGRIITGVGNGINTATVPTYQGECAPPHIRGALVLVSGALISGGIMISYWVGLGMSFVDSSASWRFPIAFQLFFAFAVVIMLFCIPESPAWLVKHDNLVEARQVLSSLYDCPEDDPSVDATINTTQQSLAEISAFQFKDLFTGGPTQNFRRAAISFLAQAFQQLTGCNLITYYATTLFEDSIGLSPFLSKLLAACNGTEYFIAAMAAVFLVDRLGRRTTMLWGAAGLGVTMVILTITVHFANQGNKPASYVACVMLFVFNSIFAFGWLGQTWLYPAEVTPLGVRAQAASLSTVANWLFNFLVVMITPPSFDSINEYTYTIFAVLNLCLIFPVVYFYFPETTRRSLEEMDLIFAEAHNENLSYIKHAATRPRISGEDLDIELRAAFAVGKAGVEAKAAHMETARPGVLRRLTTEARVTQVKKARVPIVKLDRKESNETAVESEKEKEETKEERELEGVRKLEETEKTEDDNMP
ncbi:hypothetical protein MNV49_000541 [Pseudohyphozyma bogoriensis]|nr:hypothetical protein MNV49_000541 [Pseudohyphozyma bogoriensis]